jgi:hypothetical protein
MNHSAYQEVEEPREYEQHLLYNVSEGVDFAACFFFPFPFGWGAFTGRAIGSKLAINPSAQVGIMWVHARHTVKGENSLEGSAFLHRLSLSWCHDYLM